MLTYPVQEGVSRPPLPVELEAHLELWIDEPLIHAPLLDPLVRKPLSQSQEPIARLHNLPCCLLLYPVVGLRVDLSPILDRLKRKLKHEGVHAQESGLRFACDDSLKGLRLLEALNVSHLQESPVLALLHELNALTVVLRDGSPRSPLLQSLLDNEQELKVVYLFSTFSTLLLFPYLLTHTVKQLEQLIAIVTLEHAFTVVILGSGLKLTVF